MNDRSFCSFGIVPAAGVSKRMGTQKLLLPYDGSTLIEHVLSHWSASRVDHTLVVVSPEDQNLIAKCRATDVICVIPGTRPIEMKHSVQYALTWLEQNMAPRPNDAWLLAPADLPGLSSDMIDLVVDSYNPRTPTIVVPCHRRRRGHPAMFPWSYSNDVHELAEDQGVNHLLDVHEVVDVLIDNSAILHDLDTPNDYLRAINHDL